MLEKAIVFAVVGVALCYGKSNTYCLWHINKCVDYCPDWMIEVKSDCTKSYWNSQRTCDNPEMMLMGTVCGFSRCDCPEPTVLDTTTGYCCDVDDCPTKHDE